MNPPDPSPASASVPSASGTKFQLDDNLLQQIGLGGLPPVEKNKMLAHIYETLELRVGMKLAEQMSDEQLDEFEAFIDRNDDAGALKWLETNFPNYKQVVADELEKLKSEIKAQAPAIMEATRAQATEAGAGLTPPPPAPQAEPPPSQPPIPPAPPAAAPEDQNPPVGQAPPA